MLIRWPEGSEAAAAALARPSSGAAEEVFPGSAAPSTHNQPGALTAGLLGSARAEQHRALLDTSMDRDPCVAPGYLTCSQSSSSPQCLLQVQAPQAQGSLMADPPQWRVFAVTIWALQLLAPKCSGHTPWAAAGTTGTQGHRPTPMAWACSLWPLLLLQPCDTLDSSCWHSDIPCPTMHTEQRALPQERVTILISNVCCIFNRKIQQTLLIRNRLDKHTNQQTIYIQLALYPLNSLFLPTLVPPQTHPFLHL